MLSTCTYSNLLCLIRLHYNSLIPIYIKFKKIQLENYKKHKMIEILHNLVKQNFIVNLM